MLSQLLKTSPKNSKAAPTICEPKLFPSSLKEDQLVMPSLTFSTKEKPCSVQTRKFPTQPNRPVSSTWPPSNQPVKENTSEEAATSKSSPGSRRSSPIPIPAKSLTHGKGIQNTFQLSFSVSAPLGPISSSILPSSGMNEVDLDLPELDFYLAASFSELY